ncbi:hypothetical protein KL918_005037 [Ogataea parapolymorpha]|uniref:Conserved oligomeric Golgi complex subunit 8 n=1 Tax=Ogataea parapolymorpha (strain ATCC 26012 / BCRC 20466 / JCM 22074 / NRRL Y-7560 / DL-1) TaxID=871575 RepID=W1QJG1_OGAPD|nr:Conserved oligomeric Golgi complex subunit 8 [Ogataea parapolymorpha DL-1]ESX01987.1 Conserved oligomeric Golgi complex subunit 8 [Ogataea parapolymorpha DL-1]KAG7864911.1 hypothetical protein KL918_005037 [Ogataea parapolymorpha]KAG7871587.1 hypothetical protein KL916_003938 [Ogataea parapolymorpha]
MMSESTGLLLETLWNELPTEVENLLDTSEAYKTDALKFLTDLLDQDRSETLLSTNVKPSFETEHSGHTLIERIAELESSQRILEAQIKKCVHSNLNNSLKLNKVYTDCVSMFKNDFNECREFLSTNFSKSEDAMDTQQKSEESNWKDLLKTQHPYSKHEQLQENRQSSSIILSKMDNIMDILELPALANACVKTGHYAECVEIASHVRRLSIRYSDIAIIQRVEHDVQLEIREMVNGLIRLLNTDLRQSSIIKIVTYLKRIGPFQKRLKEQEDNRLVQERDTELVSNEFLQKIFLKSRYQFILNELDVLVPLKKSNSIDNYLKRCVEVIREHCFQTVVTFESIFPNDNSKAVKNLLYSFIKSLIYRLCEILKENWSQVGDTNKDGLLLQLIYCSQSLGRIGGDFNVIILDQLKDAIDKENWCTVLRKQRELIKSLSKSMDERNVHKPIDV